MINQKLHPISLLLIFVAFSYTTFAQTQVYEDGTYLYEQTVKGEASVAENYELPLPNFSTLPTSRVERARIGIKLDLGEDYQLGDAAFQASLNFTLRAVASDGTSVTLCDQCELNINQNAPEMLYSKDIKNLIFTGGTYSDVTKFEIIGENFTKSGAASTVVSAVIDNDIRLTLQYEIDYGIDVSALSVNNLTQINDGKSYLFRWDANTYVPNYQFQLLRLYNLDETTTADDKEIKTQVDWSQALTIETQSSDNALAMTIAEGTGFYVWRVRPIGTFYEGGIANAKNYGTWSNGALTTLSPTLTASNLNLTDDAGKKYPVFFYEDVDDAKNTIYARTFTEGNRVAESISYANGLQQVRQSQTYLPSKKIKVVTQTLYDNSGRPVITTLPVPVDSENGFDGYEETFVQNEAGNLYGIDDFDGNTSYRKPAKIKQDGTAFDYYDGKDQVADAEGFPYSRVLYYNDGTGRVKEQSGVGKKHMIGDGTANSGDGKTIRTFYSTATEYELVRLFGDEAPNAQTVLKTTTIDQNGVASISYTSKEGHVIASSLSFNGDNNLLPVDGANVDNFTVQERIVNDAQKNNFLVGSKRLTFTAPTALNEIKYEVTCNQIETELGCLEANTSCNYDIRVVIAKIDGDPFEAADLQSLPAAWIAQGTGDVYSLASVPVAVTCDGPMNFPSITLPVGTFMVESQLIPRGQETIIDQNEERIAAEIQPLAGLLGGWLDDVKCDQDWQTLFDRVDGLQAELQEGAAQAVDPTKTPEQVAAYYAGLDTKYSLPTPFFNASHLVIRDGTDAIKISSTCCQNLSIPMDYVPPFDLTILKVEDKDADEKYAVNPFILNNGDYSEFFPDFEGYAYSYFWDCVPGTNHVYSGEPYPAYTVAPEEAMFTGTPEEVTQQITEAQNKVKYIYYGIIQKGMKGWHVPGTFNAMVYHMLADQYTTDGMDSEDKVVYNKPANYVDECGNEQYPAFTLSASGQRNFITNEASIPTTGAADVDGKRRQVTSQYYPEELFKCWVNQLSIVKEMYKEILPCPEAFPSGINLEGSPFYLSGRIDDEGGNHDPHIDGNIPRNFFIRWIVRRKVKKISRRMRNMQVGAVGSEGDEGGEANLIKDINFDYHVVKEFLNCTGYRFAKVLTDYNPTPLAPDENTEVTYTVPNEPLGNVADHKEELIEKVTPYNGDPLRGYQPKGDFIIIMSSDTLFNRIKDPVYAFKYYEYVEYSEPQLELLTCFNDPNWRKFKETTDLPGGETQTTVKAVYLYDEDYEANNNAPATAEIYEVDDNGIIVDPNEEGSLCEFCGVGKITCSVVHQDWTSGQRFTLYTMLQNYVKEEPIDWTLAGEDVRDFASVGYLDQVISEQTGDLVKQYVLWENEQVIAESDYEGFVNTNFVKPSTSVRYKTQVELEINQLNEQMWNACAQQRSQLKARLIDTLLQHCYVLEGCRKDLGPSASAEEIWENERIVTEDDIERLVDYMILECQARGVISTYRRISGGCRDPYTNLKRLDETNITQIWNLGYVDKEGELIRNVSRVEYGVAKPDEAGCASTAAEMYHRKPESGEISNTLEVFTPSANPDGIDYTLSTNYAGQDPLPITDCTEGPAYSYCEWLRRKEVVDFVLQMDIRSFCEGPGNIETLACETGDCPPASQLIPTDNTTTDPDHMPEYKSAPLKMKLSTTLDPEGNEVEEVTNE